jgi:voltage-dependent calcium channel T type alpha-1G
VESLHQLFNLFVAIIITGFSENKADILKEEKENAIMLEQDRLRKGASIARGPSMKSRQSIRSSTSLSRGASLTRGLSISSSGHGKSLRNSSSINSAQEKDGTGSLIERFVRWFQAKVLGIEQVTAADIQKLANEGSKKSATASEIGSQMSEQPNWSELPFMRKVIENKYWNWFIIIIILLSCISLVLQRPGISQEEQTVSIQINLACNVIFIIEMLWKVAAYRWKRYIANSWNRLDFFLVIISILDMISDVIKAAVSSADEGNPAFGILGFLKNFRAFRALRPLRILSRAKGLKVVLSTLGRAVGPVLNTVAIALICFFIFGIMSVQVMGGRLMYCSDIHALEQRDCVGIDPVTGESRMWLKRQLQYNWIGEAMLSMFVLASQDNWEMHMYAAIDATQKGKGPIANNEPGTGVFFLAILIVASFFVMQLFVGVFIDTFQTVTQENKALSRKSSLASENSSVTSATGAEAPLFWLRSVVYTVVTTKQFDLIIAAFILANIFTMAADTPKSSDIHTRILGVLEFVFNFVFGTEVIAKLWGMYPKQYFNSRWNKFDFVVVMFSYAGIAVFNLGSEFTAGLNPTMLRILRIVRIFRILRAFRIFKAAQGLQNLVRTLLRSLTAVGNLAALLLLLFFVVGVLCVELFGLSTPTPIQNLSCLSPRKFLALTISCIDLRT